MRRHLSTILDPEVPITFARPSMEVIPTSRRVADTFHVAVASKATAWAKNDSSDEVAVNFETGFRMLLSLLSFSVTHPSGDAMRSLPDFLAQTRHNVCRFNLATIFEVKSAVSLTVHELVTTLQVSFKPAKLFQKHS